MAKNAKMPIKRGKNIFHEGVTGPNSTAVFSGGRIDTSQKIMLWTHVCGDYHTVFEPTKPMCPMFSTSRRLLLESDG
jgi:hypothetical protein